MTLDEHISNIKHLIWLCCNNVSQNELVDYVNNYSNSVYFIMNDKYVDLVFGIYDSTMHFLKSILISMELGAKQYLLNNTRILIVLLCKNN